MMNNAVLEGLTLVKMAASGNPHHPHPRTIKVCEGATLILFHILMVSFSSCWPGLPLASPSFQNLRLCQVCKRRVKLFYYLSLFYVGALSHFL